MFYDNELRFLQKMLEKCHVQSIVVDPAAPLDHCDDVLLSQMMSHYHVSGSLNDYVTEIKPATVYRLMDAYMCRFIFLELPFCTQPTVLLIGPYLITDLDRQQIMEHAERIRLGPDSLPGLEKFYASLPLVREENHLFAMVNTFAEYVFSGSDNYDSVDLYFEHHTIALPSLAHRNGSDSEWVDAQAMEDRYQFENQLIEAVSQGNSHKAELLMASVSPLAFESRSSDQLRNTKNYCIIMNTLMRKAAEKGRVHPVHLDRVSSDFAHRIEALRSLSAVPDFMIELLRTYCRLVKRYSIGQFSLPVQKAMLLIEGDLGGELSLSTVAVKINVSPGYLSGLFKKETGKTFTAYVNGRRIEMAKHLLKTTYLQIQTIAQHCGILDFHYFCRLFKSIVGKTPTEYRNANAATVIAE